MNVEPRFLICFIDDRNVSSLISLLELSRGNLRRHLKVYVVHLMMLFDRSPTISLYGLVHIAAGDLLRAEIAADTVNGKLAKEYMEKGMLVPDEIVVVMVKEFLLQTHLQENGLLLDGYPRSLSQAKALEDLGIRPDLFILMDVNENILVERVVGRRLDPVTGKIYHLKYSPPENEEIARRLVQRFDDTEEKDAEIANCLRTRICAVEQELADTKTRLVASLAEKSGEKPGGSSSVGQKSLHFTPREVEGTRKLLIT
ncbi:hypothetical protein KSP40_PGU015500 [Platanthera guangdongensis]|uniref:adenylate kinase n=1 Tax=Platanthera guangdongensis TaxID=2320717 RepID=A0ABR2MLI6_9ASPA